MQCCMEKYSKLHDVQPYSCAWHCPFRDPSNNIALACTVQYSTVQYSTVHNNILMYRVML